MKQLVFTENFIEESYELFEKLKRKRGSQFVRFDSFLEFRHQQIQLEYPGFKHICIHL